MLIFSGHANHSQHVLDELTYAVDEELTILPFRIENLTPKGAMKLHLSARHWLDAYKPSWEAYLDNLVQNIAGILGVSLPTTEEKPEEPRGERQNPNLNLRKSCPT